MDFKHAKILVLSLVAVFALAFPLFASEEGHQGGVGEGVRVPETVSSIWHEIKEHEEHLNETIKAGKLDDVHKMAFTIRDLSKALSEKSVDLAADQLAKVKSSVERIAEVADLLDKYGDAGDKVNTEDQFVRLGKLLQFIEMQYPHDVLLKAEGSPAHAEGVPHSKEPAKTE